MGNNHSSENGNTRHHDHHNKGKREGHGPAAPKQRVMINTPFLSSMFSKLEKRSAVAAGEDSRPGFISKDVFEDAFNGPLHVLGHLLFKHIQDQFAPSSPSHHQEPANGTPDTVEGDWISRQQFLLVCSEILNLISDTQQNSYYFDVFSEGKERMSYEAVEQMVRVSFSVSLHSAYITHEISAYDNRILEGLAIGIMGSGKWLIKDNFEIWCQKYCQFLFNGIHCFLMLKLSGSEVDEEGWHKRMAGETEFKEVTGTMLEALETRSGSMSYSLLWLLSCALPACYTKGMSTTTVNGAYVPSFLINKLHQLTKHSPWTLLYNSDDHGRSANRFEHHVMSYRGSSVSMFEFGSCVYALATDTEWRQSSQKWGGSDTILLQLSPHFSVVEAGSNIIYMNLTNRAMPKGVHFGSDAKDLGLKIEDMSVAKARGMEEGTDLQLIEVWGCAEPTVKEMQLRQRQWEKREAEKQGNRKLKLENWEDNPDRMLLNWAGIKTNHAEKA